MTNETSLKTVQMPKERKKKGKKKKMSAYKKLLRSIKTPRKTEEQKKEDYRRKISQSLGGGKFNKIDNI
jgi:formiminotetrahydrofolate cyclodeaminase